MTYRQIAPLLVYDYSRTRQTVYSARFPLRFTHTPSSTAAEKKQYPNALASLGNARATHPNGLHITPLTQRQQSLVVRRGKVSAHQRPVHRTPRSSSSSRPSCTSFRCSAEWPPL